MPDDCGVVIGDRLSGGPGGKSPRRPMSWKTRSCRPLHPRRHERRARCGLRGLAVKPMPGIDRTGRSPTHPRKWMPGIEHAGLDRLGHRRDASSCMGSGWCARARPPLPPPRSTCRLLGRRDRRDAGFNGSPHVSAMCQWRTGHRLRYARRSAQAATRSAHRCLDPVRPHQRVGLREYLVLNGRARITRGGAAEPLQRLARTYIGPEAVFPGCRSAGFVTDVVDDMRRRSGGGTTTRPPEAPAIGETTNRLEITPARRPRPGLATTEEAIQHLAEHRLVGCGARWRAPCRSQRSRVDGADDLLPAIASASRAWSQARNWI